MAGKKRAPDRSIQQPPKKRAKGKNEGENARKGSICRRRTVQPARTGGPTTRNHATVAQSSTSTVTRAEDADLSKNGSTAAAGGEPREEPVTETSRQKQEHLTLVLDIGNSQTQVAYCWEAKALFWFDKWAGELGRTQIPTLVTAYQKSDGGWARTFGVHARTDSHQIDGAVVFDRLKMNFDPDSKYLDDQKEKEAKTQYYDNWNFFLESLLTTVLDGVIDPNHTPSKVSVYLGPPAKWDATIIARYTASIKQPPKWRGKFDMMVRVLNEASAAFLGRVNNGLKLRNGQRAILIDLGHGTTEFTTVRKDPHSHAIEHYAGVIHGSLEIDEFAKTKLAEAYPTDSRPSERLLNEWVDNCFQPRYKIDILGEGTWYFDGKPLPQKMKKEIVDFALSFYGDLAARVREYVAQQSEKGEVQTVVLTGGGAAAVAFQKELRQFPGRWDFSPQQQNDVIWGHYYHSRNPTRLSYDYWPLTIGIRTDDENIKSLKSLPAKSSKAVFFTEKGAKVPDVLTRIVWDLTREEKEFKFDVSLLVTNEDLSMVPYEKGTNFKELSAQNCAELSHEPVVLDVRSKRATVYVYPVPEGDMLALIIIGRKDGQESPLLDKMKLFRTRNFRLDGFDGPEYVRKEVRIATGKEYLGGNR